MRDERVQLVLAITLLYLAQGMFGNWISLLFCTPHAATAYLRSVSSDVLMVETNPGVVHRDARHVSPAAHAPFFFEAIPINSANKEMLMTVKGIGPSLAESILSYRQRFGPLKSVEDLTKIQGVGTKRAASLAPSLFFGEAP